jgi:hypothetical protein
MKVFDQLSEMKTPEEIENIMTEILPMFYVKVIHIGWDQEPPIFLPS